MLDGYLAMVANSGKCATSDIVTTLAFLVTMIVGLS